MKNKIHFVIPFLQKEVTLKEFLKSNHVGRGKIEEIRVINEITINNNKATLDSYIHQGDEIYLVSNEKEVEGYKGPIDILYEDEGIIALNKEEGILVHSDGNEKDTLLSRIAYYRQNKNEPSIVYPLHRLDKETSGVILFAKDFFHGAIFDDLFANGKIKRTYEAICKGKLNKDEGELRFYIGKNRHNPEKMIILNKGQLVICQYKVLKKTNEYSHLLINIMTGKRHQIRVSFSHINHPLVGDKLYGSPYEKGPLLLEATFLEFMDPLRQKKVIIKSPLRKEIKNFFR